MSRTLGKGLLVAALHVTIVASLGAKLVIDRSTRPRVWARAAPFDPNLPIRGRYVRLQIEGAVAAGSSIEDARRQVASGVRLVAQDGQLVFVPASESSGPTALTAQVRSRDGAPVAVLDQPLAYFIPEHVADPSRRPPGEELWVEVTIPRAGRPRPIQLGVKKDGVLTPLYN